MFKTKYFWRGYLLGIGIALLGIGYITSKINTTRTVKTIKSFNEVSFTNLKGDTLSVKKAGSELVLINYWGTYCAPCIKEMPLLLAFSKQYPQIKIWLLTEEKTDVIDKFILQHPEFKKMNFAHLVKAEKSIGVNNINSILPASFLLKNDGRVLWKNDGQLGYKSPQDMLDNIQKKVPEVRKLVSPNLI